MFIIVYIACFLELIVFTAYFIDDPTDRKCIEGEDVNFKCKVFPDCPSVKWIRNDKELVNNENCKITSRDSEHELTLRNTTMNDTGEYCVKIKKSLRIINLNVRGIYALKKLKRILR